jgi:hypothetical protein
MVIDDKISGSFHTSGGVLSPTLFSMVKDKIIRKEGQRGLIEIMMHGDDIAIRKTNKSTLENKFHRVVTVCEDFGLNVNFHKQKVGRGAWKR